MRALLFFSLLVQFGWASSLRAILLLGENDSPFPEEEIQDRSGVEVFDVSLPGSFSDLNHALTPFLGETLNDQTIQDVKRKLYHYYQVRGYPFILLSVPNQDYATGVLQVFVEESKLGKIDVEGNQWTKDSRYTDYFNVKPGERISTRQVSTDVGFINRNPYRKVDVLYAPGTEHNTTDITLVVEDRKPYRFYVGADNTGVPTTGRQRIFAGFSWDQIFGFDQTFFYQYTTNTNVNRFHSNMFQYMALLPWKAVLQIYGGYSTVEAKLPAPNRNNKGTNIQASFRYSTPFLVNHIFSQEVTFGFDLKNTNNTMEFVDFTPTFGQTVNLSQFLLGYRCNYQRDRTHTQGGVSLFVSPGKWLPDQSNTDFASLRPGAKNNWVYAFAYFNVHRGFGRGWSYVIDFRGQLSSQTLLPSEQLGMGGYDTVRGYDERQYNADNGCLASFELHAPTFTFPSRKESPKNKDQGYFFLFLDSGLGFDKTKVPGFHIEEYLLGTGPGFRYAIPPYFDARLDWGIKLHHQEGFTGGWSMLHFRVTGSY